MRPDSLTARLCLCIAVVLALSARTTPAQDTLFGPISVPATAVIFDPDNVLSSDQLAAMQSAGPLTPVPAVKAFSFKAAAGQTLTLSASGMVGCCSVPQVGPDGYVGSNESISGVGSISGFTAPSGLPLVGVFTNGNPRGAAPPPPYDYSAGVSSLSQLSMSPVLNQVFFIGDGLTGTGSGTQQILNVPPTATELWLGFVDGGTFQGPPSNYGDNPGSLNVRGTFSVVNCAAFSDIDSGKASIRTYPTLTSNAGLSNASEVAGYLYIYAGVRQNGQPQSPYGIEADLSNAFVPKYGPGEAGAASLPMTFPADFISEVVQNLVRWHGNAVYGQGAGAKTEYPAAVADGASTPLVDPPPKGTQAYLPYFADSPDIIVPLRDKQGLLLSAVCYEKDFEDFAGCQTGDPGKFHTIATFTWQAHYCGTVTVDAPAGSQPTAAMAHFTPTTNTAVTYTQLVRSGQQPVLTPGACETSYVDLNGAVIGHCSKTVSHH